MKYFYYVWKDELKTYEPIEITSNKAFITLSYYYRTKLVKRLKGKSFRLRTSIGWIETETVDGLRPIAGFYGICE